MRVETTTISWKPPKCDGGSRVKAYIIERRDAACNFWTQAGSVDGGKTSYHVPNLTTDQEYYFRVYAENDMGVSEPVTMTAPVKIQSGYGQSSRRHATGGERPAR